MRTPRETRDALPGTDDLAAMVRAAAQPLHGPADLDPLMERIGDARLVLLGEASHGTSEYYTWRAALSRRLIREKGFSFVAVEGDWPDCYRVNRYVKGYEDSGESAYEVLHAFDRWPTWMWANREVEEFTEWLRRRNFILPEERKVGFYGLDVYSLWDSLRAVLEYLEDADGGAVEAARAALRCFEPFGGDVQDYAWHTMMVPDACEDDVVELLRALRGAAPQFQNDGRESYFDAEQNAFVAKNAERYYRAMVRSNASSWNVRDEHMADTLDRLLAHHGPDARAIVWEHNTHIGDSRHTDMARAGMHNIGRLARERHERDGAVLVGFGGYRGSVIAGRAWNAPMERMPVPEAIPGSWEDVMRRAAMANGSGSGAMLLMLEDLRNSEVATQARGHRAIGVVYDPDHERGNYVPSSLPWRYDAFLFFENTRALRPIHMEPKDDGEVPETYPSAV